jgi:ribosomal protein L19
MNELRTAQRKPLPYPQFNPGDALEVLMLPYKSADKPVYFLLLLFFIVSKYVCVNNVYVCVCLQQVIRGVVIAKSNRGADSSFILRDVSAHNIKYVVGLFLFFYVVLQF